MGDIERGDMEAGVFEGVEPADNPEARVALALVLDTSGSMQGPPIDELNKGLETLAQNLKQDERASVAVDIAIFTFGGTASMFMDFTSALEFSPPQFTARGMTPLAEAVLLALQSIRKRVEFYKRQGIPYYRPWMFLITDGAHNGSDDAWHEAVSALDRAEKDRRLLFFAVGTESADVDKLKQLDGGRRGVLRLKGLDFTSLFTWLSASMQAVSRSRPGEKVSTPPISGWGEITI